jgi:outer membrane murein-binding lipoprotein Lpp
MMNAKDAIMQIRALFEDMPQVEAPAPAPAPIEEVPVTFAEYSLLDGTKVMISELAIGGQVTLADGSPAPMGEHQLADGTKIVLDEAAKILSIETPEAEAEIADETPAEMGKKMDEKMADEIAALVSENENLKSQVAQLEAKVKNGFSQVAELIEALTKTPNAEPIAQPKNNFSANVTTHNMKYERLEKFRNALLNK